MVHLVSVPPLGAFKKTKPLTGAGFFHHPESCPRSTASHGAPRHGTDEKLPLGPQMLRYLLERWDAEARKILEFPLTHGAAGICLFLVGSELRKVTESYVQREGEVSPVTGVSLSASWGFQVGGRLCPKWTARDCPVGPPIDVGFASRDWPILVLGARPPIPAHKPRAAGPSPSLPPRPNRRPPSCPWGRDFLALASANEKSDERCCAFAPQSPVADMLRVTRDET